MQRVERLKKLGVLVEPVKVTLNSSGWLKVDGFVEPPGGGTVDEGGVDG
jgi:hypothetical protein